MFPVCYKKITGVLKVVTNKICHKSVAYINSKEQGMLMDQDRGKH